jgi:hypothetical protein
MNYLNPYKNLRKNASLAAVAKAASANSRAAHRKYQGCFVAIQKAHAAGEYIRPDTMGYREELFEYFRECSSLADHLNRLAGTGYSVYSLPKPNQ